MTRLDQADRNGDGRLARNESTGPTTAFKRMDENGDASSRVRFLTMRPPRARRHVRAGEPRNTTRAYQSPARERGGTEGVRPARKTRASPRPLGHRRTTRAEQADSDYTAELGVRVDYQSGYRAGFRLGYAKDSDRAKRNRYRHPNNRILKYRCDRSTTTPCMSIGRSVSPEGRPRQGHGQSPTSTTSPFPACSTASPCGARPARPHPADSPYGENISEDEFAVVTAADIPTPTSSRLLPTTSPTSPTTRQSPRGAGYVLPAHPNRRC